MPRESMFDDRYRYDYIYPRGRSGEALRAYDTQQQDRPVVIKRPAPQDAPPIRAGQEVNIRTERRALTQLRGHPVLAELVGEGTFQVGGQTHLYIALERVTGQILEDLVLELAKTNERLPELEMLVIVDALLDLLEAAHAREIVYNDVDAKHLFWDRDAYRLKVIDWGNAVFLEGDEVTPQGISRQSDIYQVGELLYFVVTGGQRLALQGDRVDFGEDAGRLSTRFQGIIQRAVHPALDRRYKTITALRRDLEDYRRPLERDRTAVLDRVAGRLQKGRSQRELERLLDEIKTVQARDPGHPPTRDLRRQIEDNLRRLALQSDLDAARIYLESGSWTRAAALLGEVVAQTPEAERPQVQLLLEVAQLLENSDLRPPPAGLIPASHALFEGDFLGAARLLQVTVEPRDDARMQQVLFATRIQDCVPDVIVLRPHLLRLRLDLFGLSRRHRLDAALELVEDSLAVLEAASTGRLTQLAESYRRVAEAMRDVVMLLEERLQDRAADDLAALILSARRASAAAAAILGHLQVAGAQATAEPDAARAALVQAESIDPVNPAFVALRGRLDDLNRLIERLAAYHPVADGSDLDAWFGEALRDLGAYVDDAPDPRLGMLVGGLREAHHAWAAYQQAAVAGSRRDAVSALEQAIRAVRRLNATLAAWLSNVRGVVEKARYVQRHALNQPFGRILADGWAAWDRGSGIEAERLGRQALEEVANDAEQAAADRLIRLGKLLRTWKEGHGEGDPDLTARTDAEVVSLFTEAESLHWQTFTDQMPSPAAYLKAMGAGLVEHFEETSTAAQRILFFHAVLRGINEMYEGRPDDAEFWRAAAQQCLPDAVHHVAYLALTNVIRDRRELAALTAQIEAIGTPDALAAARRRLETSPLQLILAPLTESLHQVEYALPQWEEGDFRGAGQSLEAALLRLDEGERLARVSLPRFRAWINRLQAKTAELHITRQRIDEAVQSPHETPDPALLVWHARLIDDTAAFLGEGRTGRFVAWRDTYATMLGIYADENRRRSRKLRDLDGQFHTPKIDTHPAYPLYRFWRECVEARPEFPAPPTDEPIPQYTAEAPVVADHEAVHLVRPHLSRRRLLWGGALLLVVMIGLLGLSALLGSGGQGQIAVTWQTFTPTLNPQAIAATITVIQGETAAAVAATETATPTSSPTNTPTNTSTPTETPVPTLEPGGALPTVAILTATPTSTPSPTETPTAPLPTETVVAAIPTLAGPLSGEQNVLAALEQVVQGYPWPEAWFRRGDFSGGWLLGVPETAFNNDVIQVVLPADLLAQMFGDNAAVRLRRVEATFTLRDYDRALLPEGQVFFGLGLQGADESRVALQAQWVREDAVNIGARVGEEFRARSTLPIGEPRVVLSLVRNTDGTVDLLFNGASIGPSRFLTAPNAPAVPFVLVHRGGVVVSVTNFVAQLDAQLE